MRGLILMTYAIVPFIIIDIIIGGFAYSINCFIMNDGYGEVVDGSANNILFEYDEITEKCMHWYVYGSRSWIVLVCLVAVFYDVIAVWLTDFEC